MKAGMGKNQKDRKRTEGRKKGREKQRNKQKTNTQTKEERKNLQRCQCCHVTVITVPLVASILGYSGRVSTACFNPYRTNVENSVSS